ncbi:MAG: hypothetical protein IJS45_09740, partial [Clostridia bacterium]|nr:hypothetical protein [Clostridia bacterium]
KKYQIVLAFLALLCDNILWCYCFSSTQLYHKTEPKSLLLLQLWLCFFRDFCYSPLLIRSDKRFIMAHDQCAGFVKADPRGVQIVDWKLHK